jgi:hypothetical protein
MGASVAPYVPASETSKSPPKTTFKKPEEYPQPFMEIDEDQSTVASEAVDRDTRAKRLYLRDYNRLPSVPSMPSME